MNTLKYHNLKKVALVGAGCKNGTADSSYSKHQAVNYIYSEQICHCTLFPTLSLYSTEPSVKRVTAQNGVK